MTDDMNIPEMRKVLGIKTKKRTRTDKKAFWSFMIWCFVIQIITLYMAILMQSETLLGIFAVEAVAGPVFVYKFYLEYNKAPDHKGPESLFIGPGPFLCLDS
jgi:hypothetical protein